MKIITFLIVTLMLSSCVTLILNSELKRIGVFEENCRITYLSNGYKKVAFFPMHHFGKQEFYDDVAFKIDSLQKENYQVLYEGYLEEIVTDSLIQDINQRKLRKLLGIATTEYFDPETNRFGGKYKIYKKHKLINQPDPYLLKIDTSNAKRVDISPSTMISEFEKVYDEIQLSACDLMTSLNAKVYDCHQIEKSKRGHFMDEIIFDLRDKNLAIEVHNHPSEKIAVVYGQFHAKGMRLELGKIDSNWEYNSKRKTQTTP